MILMKNLLSIFVEQKFSCELIYLVRIIFWVKIHLKKQDLETGLPSPMPGTVRGSIPNGASAFAPHPLVCFLNIRYRTKLRSKASSPISWQLVMADMPILYGRNTCSENFLQISMDKKMMRYVSLTENGLTVVTLSFCAVFSINISHQYNILFHLMNKTFIQAWKEFYYSVFSGNHKFAINRRKARQNQSYGRSPFPLSENPEAVWRIRLFLEDQLLCLKRAVGIVIKGLQITVITYIVSLNTPSSGSLPPLPPKSAQCSLF